MCTECNREDAADAQVKRITDELDQVYEAAGLAWQALLWRGPNDLSDTQVEAALRALQRLGIAPLPYWKARSPDRLGN